MVAQTVIFGVLGLQALLIGVMAWYFTRASYRQLQLIRILTEQLLAFKNPWVHQSYEASASALGRQGNGVVSRLPVEEEEVFDEPEVLG